MEIRTANLRFMVIAASYIRRKISAPCSSRAPLLFNHHHKPTRRNREMDGKCNRPVGLEGGCDIHLAAFPVEANISLFWAVAEIHHYARKAPVVLVEAFENGISDVLAALDGRSKGIPDTRRLPHRR